MWILVRWMLQLFIYHQICFGIAVVGQFLNKPAVAVPRPTDSLIGLPALTNEGKFAGPSAKVRWIETGNFVVFFKQTWTRVTVYQQHSILSPYPQKSSRVSGEQGSCQLITLQVLPYGCCPSSSCGCWGSGIWPDCSGCRTMCTLHRFRSVVRVLSCSFFSLFFNWGGLQALSLPPAQILVKWFETGRRKKRGW